MTIINIIIFVLFAPGSEVRTDGLGIYNALSDGYAHKPKNFSPGKEPEHLHWLHTIISNAKAFISGTFHGLGSAHLQRYLDEFCYRFNRRRFGDGIFPRLVRPASGRGKLPIMN